MRFCLFAAVVAVLIPVSALHAQETTVPNPKDHRPEIRAALLKVTPLGLSSREVLERIRTSLLPADQKPPQLESHPAVTDAAGDPAEKGVTSIQYMLGSYLVNPAVIALSAPLLLQREVTVSWAFDKNDRLMEIFVDKRTATY